LGLFFLLVHIEGVPPLATKSKKVKNRKNDFTVTP
jgi:hypothetical protein